MVGPGLGDNGSTPTAGQDPKTFEVVNSSQVKFLDGLMAYGVGSTYGRFSECGYGNLTGKPTPGNKFSKLAIGQSMQEVLALAGYPDGQHVGLAKHVGFSLNKVDVREDYRVETAYTGAGRLVFAYVDPNYKQLTPGILNTTTRVPCPGLRLKWIIYNPREPAGPLESENAHLVPYSGPAPEGGADLIAAPGSNQLGRVVDACQLKRTGPESPGEVSGKPAPNSKFNLLQLGMTKARVQDILGPPTAISKCGRPMYAGMGELEFSSPPTGSERLTWIIHSP